MKKITVLTFALLMFCSNAFSQHYDKKKFKSLVSEDLNKRYNITHVPNDFYDCAYKIYKQIDDTDGVNYKAGIKMSEKCLTKYMNKVEFSDDGVKLLKVRGKERYTKGCVAQYSKKERDIDFKKYCQCTYNQYIKHDIGEEDLYDPDFRNSELNNNLLRHCYSKAKK